ncbi:M20/M25/M40 family metallo-hydrolase [Pseudodesulfovibrio sp. JC047]|uniref:M20 family metallopeptidase n=1 Tax=Pseudodesulfovibrio sp. JC047 TaxID=2683199 RepID=UPI0013D73111|nr:M20 family metallopeptidase [Pseudodesulfovibrio sp. JC047]NDV18716.1 M20/M25/M40 family metallo-hydrolase [Pseudodesulfovibrio sp. JC047]
MQRIIRSYLADHEQEMMDLLEKTVRINSYTPNKQGTDAVVTVFEQVMTDMGFTVQREKQDNVGDNLIARKNCTSDAPGLLLCGHMDTVFPPDDGFDCFRPEGDTIIGPGVIDMKGGLVVGIYALKALDTAGLLDHMPITFVFNSDEEIGSPNSQALIIEEARKAAAAFVFECSGPGGKVVTARKGKISFILNVQGKAGHSGNLSGPKASAILEMAHQTIRLEALNDAAKGISLNVGLVEGGIGPNTVAPSASAKIECRYWHEEDGVLLQKAIEQSAASPTIPGTQCSLQRIPGRPTMETSPAITKLFDIVAKAGADLNIAVQESARGGVSDANFIANAGTPVIDGLGPTGGKDHSHNEYMLTRSLTERTILAAEVLRRTFETFI